MSSEADPPRQRTVAELLAEHGDSGATGRRRRRRQADEPEEGGPAAPAGAAGSTAATPWAPAPAEVQHPAGREPAAHDQVQELRDGPAWDAPAWEPPQEPAQQRETLPRRDWPQPRAQLPQRELPHHDLFQERPASSPDAPRWDAPPAELPRREVQRPDVPLWESAPAPQAPPPGAPAPGPPAPVTGAQPPPLAGQAPLRPPRERPTEQIPRLRGALPGVPDPNLTGPIQHARPVVVPAPLHDDPDVEDGHVDQGPGDGAIDDGPPTMVGAAPPGAEAWHRARVAGAGADDGGQPTQAVRPRDFDGFGDHPAGLGGVGVDEAIDAPPVEQPPSRRAARAAAEPTAQSWAPVLAQWIVGAIGGAALWVGFRFLWGNLLVVAIAASVLVTVGLVVVVRALLRNNDLRTTVFAVLVGLLLTVSPAILVLTER